MYPKVVRAAWSSHGRTDRCEPSREARAHETNAVHVAVGKRRGRAYPQIVLGDINEPVGDSLPGLTRRESEVLALAAQGLTNEQLARQLHVSTHAVKFHLAAIYRKLHVGNRTEASARYFMSLRTLAPDPIPNQDNP